MSIVELKQVEKKYQNVHALQALDLSLNSGEVFGLFGHNGAGKTTVIKLILGLIEATSGQISVFGENPTQASAQHIRGKLGFLQENVSFYDHLTGLEVLEYFAALKGIAKKQCADLLEQVGLTLASKRRVRTYSKGMRQRLGLAQALLGKPKLLLLDEVDAPLDDANVGRYARLVKAMSEKVQFIYITHNKIAMEKADQLMGVTMHEPGVSRLVSVDIEEAVKMVEA